ncbi:M36 family metallopeptidase [Patiriisocius sp. Uisw_047]|uniref:M36 family metallopeptidase n=1 Tax=Patiriisocius sp. Uisw_047 TaxID=3230969 RepID=UPI0039E7DBC3
MKNNYSASISNSHMNKTLIFIGVLLIMSISLIAQNKRGDNYSKITSQGYLEQLLLQKSSNELVITGTHTSKLSGITHTYVRQAINGMEVCGTESSLHSDAAGKTIMAHVNFVANIDASMKNATASITAEQAIAGVSQQMGYNLSNLQRLENATGSNQKGVFNGAGISNRDIPVKLMYYFKEGLGTTMVWELSVMEKNTPDWWNFRVDASSGRIIDKDNWTASCNVMGDHSEEGHKAMAKNKALKIAEIKSASPVYTVNEENSALVQTYNVFALPKEDPYDGPRTMEVSPANATASPLGWHDVGTTSYTYTKGNNAAAYDDGDNDDIGTEADHTPQSAAGLIFNYAFDATEPGGNPIYSAAEQSEDAAITNLFYWNNIIHDLMYPYGFDEAAGNFQENNFANGGAGGDSVDAQAQDSANLTSTGSNRCNANFGTPADGGNPRMQMYICDAGPTPDHNDGDFDSNVIIHEYAHGISNRLVGGPGVANGLQNMEQMGEGWSDFYGYMLTMNATNASSDRAIGNFLFDLGSTGGGIRNAPYSTNLTTNPWTYSGVANTGQISRPHGIGFIWATMLYEMAQALIIRDGFDPNLYTGTGGNNTAIKLVTEGLKLTPTSPGFVDGRDAILAADLALNGGVNQCLIWTAFAKRGLGFGASQGSSDNRTDGVEAFDIPVAAFAPSRILICMSEGVVAGLTGGTLIGGIYSGPNVTDGGDGLTFSFDASAASVGMNTITYTDPCTATMAMATINVTDGVPVVSCMNVTLTLDGAGMAIYDPLALIIPGTLAVVGSNIGSNSSGTTTMQVSISQSVNISFDWLFESTDNPGFDDFGYTLNGTFTNLSNAAAYPASANSSLSLSNGDVFGFTVKTDDNGFGSATSTITNFLPGFHGQFAEANWTEVHTNSDGSTNFSGNISSTTITGECGSPSVVSASQTVFTCNDIGDTIVTISADNGIGIGNCDLTVTIVGPTSTYNAGGWDVAPSASSKAIINAPYITSVIGSLDVCSCEMNANLSITSDNYVKIERNLKVNTGAQLLIAHTGSFVQVNDAASVTNNGTINVNVTTPLLKPRDFIISGSPMTAETRDGVHNASFRVMDHATLDFFPDPLVDAFYAPNIVANFMDDNFNDWSHYTGTINPAEAYLVSPQASLQDGNSTYNLVFNQGTLNNGIVSYALDFHIDKNSSPNMLSNPYASAIDAELFINANSEIDEVYFWEHITTPSQSFPGGNTANFSMEDISMYNLSGGIGAGTVATNGGMTPNGFIATSQGFGVKATAAGTATFNNSMRVTTGNNTLRTTDLLRDRIWLNVVSKTNDLSSETLIAFTDNATEGFDQGYDSEQIAKFLSLYSHIENENSLLGIQAREALSEDKEVSLGFSTLNEEVDTYNISIKQLEGSNIEGYTVYLEDHLTGLKVNLSESEYEFAANAGVYNNRFTLSFTDRNVLDISEVSLQNISVSPNPTEGQVIIQSPNLEINNIIVRDVQGRTVKQVRNLKAQSYTLDFSEMSSAVYFINIETQDGSIIKRIVKK